VAPGDTVVVISHGGETDEIVRLMPFMRQVASKVVALTGAPGSSIARGSDVVLDVSVETEACPLGLAPTASSTAALAMGDALAMALLERKGFSAADFGRLHPAGKLGRRFLRVSDLMHQGPDVPIVRPDTRMRDVIHEISAKRLGMTTVVEGRRLAGVITDGDLRRLFERSERPLEATAGQVMSRHPRTCPPDLLALRALELMEAPPHRITSLVVVGGDAEVLGVLHLHDLWRTR
jgi:arabinose-5-phosphate isomerase